MSAIDASPVAEGTALPSARPRIRRADLPAGECLCSYCTAKCCRYFALPIDKPTEWRDFDHLRWFMLHGRVGAFVEDDTWYLVVYADCDKLRPDQMCGIYETRPDICRAYTTDSCEYDDEAVYDQFFEVPEQIVEYAEALLPADQIPPYLRGRGGSVGSGDSLPIV